MSDVLDRNLQRAQQMLDIGHVDGAIEELRRVLTEDPDLADAHALLAFCLLRKRRLHAASLEAGLAITLAPESLLAHWVSAEVCLAKRDFAVAEKHVEYLLAESPETPSFHRLKARGLILVGRGRQRLPVLDEALRHDPNDPETLADLAECHAELGNLDAASRYAESALRIAPENQSALVAMGVTLLRRGDVEGAREHAVLALRADPNQPSALHLLTSIKARTSPLLGLWWRYATWMEGLGSTRGIVVLLGAFVVYRLVVIIANTHSAEGLAAGVQLAWLAIAAYSFVGPTLFRRALQRELASVRLGSF